jgi:hypothetical protein
MKPQVLHGWDAESPEAKARWFQSLTMEERLEVFNEFYELAVCINPGLRDKKAHAQKFEGRVRVLELP